MQFRTGRETYNEKYKQAMELCKKGMSATEIATTLDISYSTAYHWIKGLRKPEIGNLKEFEAFLQTNGPSPEANIEEKFPKHNEIFHTASARGSPIRRYVLENPRSFGKLATWYYVKGQESELKARIKAFMEMLSKK